MNTRQQTTSAPATGIVPAVMTVPSVAFYLGLGESTVWKLIREKKLHAIKMGRATRVLRSDADAFLANLRDAA